jgi:hypothetical protein
MASGPTSSLRHQAWKRPRSSPPGLGDASCCALRQAVTIGGAGRRGRRPALASASHQPNVAPRTGPGALLVAWLGTHGPLPRRRVARLSLQDHHQRSGPDSFAAMPPTFWVAVQSRVSPGDHRAHAGLAGRVPHQPVLGSRDDRRPCPGARPADPRGTELQRENARLRRELGGTRGRTARWWGRGRRPARPSGQPAHRVRGGVRPGPNPNVGARNGGLGGAGRRGVGSPAAPARARQVLPPESDGG